MSKQLALDLGMGTAPEPMWALTLLQPWAWFILRPDITDPAERIRALETRRMKDGENRKWAPEGTIKPGGVLWLHAGAEMSQPYFDETCQWVIDRGLVEAYELPRFEDIALGGLVGYVTFVGVETASSSPWFMGPKFWRIRNATLTEFKPMPGKQSIFDAGKMLEKAADRERRRDMQERKWK